ncbi:MAG: hypothetical protein M4579_002065 [Chaenotheca gracillima]|nr:MAG: hypothetical protein M4579_002065 [Chaenotheca gracillima]
MEDQNTRVEDYLNDKLQTKADLQNLDTLLLDVKNQQELLREQLQEAETSFESSTKKVRSHTSSVLQRAELFEKEQRTIDRRLLVVTRAETSDAAARKFQKSVDKLQRLDVATAYVQLLKEVDDLSAQARKQIKTDSDAGLRPYVRLQQISSSLKVLQPAAEGAAPHLIDHVEKVTGALWKDMKLIHSTELEQVLEKIRWPSKDAKLLGATLQAWRDAVEKLLRMQDPELVSNEKAQYDPKAGQDPLVLLPLEVMVKPLELRFRYHFDGDRPTNRLDKPEYFMSHITDLLNTYNSFFVEYLQPVLQSHFENSELAFNPAYMDATSALITSLLPMLRAKVFSLLPQIASQPQLLSHFVHELISFDTSLREEWSYDGAGGARSWRGITWEVLVQKDWFGRWLQVEKEFALSRYQNIIDAPDGREIDYDSLDPGATKPTKAAIRVNDLLETVTDRYKPLTSFSQKLRFLIDIQIAIFDKFHERLRSGLEAYLAATSTVVRAVQGVGKDEKASIKGMGGLERLCRIFGSAEYLEKAMGDWSDDIFFLELWDELQDRARGSTSSNLAGPMSLEHIAERTSSAVGSDQDSGALFDETAGAYRSVRVHAEETIVDLLNSSIRESLRPYSRINPWSSLDVDSSSSSAMSISAELDVVIQQLKTFFSYLSPVLGRAPLRRVSRQLLLHIQTYLWDYVLMRNTFSSAGASQFSRDVRGIWDVMDSHIGLGQAEIGMRKLSEGITLLTLPVQAAEEEEISLGEIEQQMFASNEKARDALEQIGLVLLTESEGRSILERRVELAS